MKLLTQSNTSPATELKKRRLYAFVIDLVAISLIEKTLNFKLYSLFQKTFSHAPQSSLEFFQNEFSSLRLINLLIVFWSYFFLTHLMSDGKTLGKLIFKLKVVNPTDEEVTIKQYFLRSLGYISCYLLGSIFFALPLFNKKSLSVSDLFSGTIVADDSKPITTKESSQEDDEQLKLFA